MAAKPNSVDDYLSGFSPEIAERMAAIRALIKKVAPEAEETVKYGMPTYVLGGNLVFFAGYKRHIGVYPVPQGDAAFREALAPYLAEKSTARFPHDRPIPEDLIEKLVRLRVAEEMERRSG